MIWIPEKGAIAKLPSAVRGGFWILISGSAFVCMMAIVRHLADDLHMFVIMFWRSLLGVVFMTPWLMRTGLGALNSSKKGWHAARAVIGMSGWLCIFYALTMLPLADIVAMSFIRPVFVSIAAILILGEILRWRRWIAVAVGFAGALMVVRPGYIEFNPGVILVMANVIIGTANVITVKYLSRTESPDTITMYLMLFLSPLSLFAALFVWKTPTFDQAGWLLLLAFLGTISQRTFGRAYQATDATVVQAFDFTRLIVAAVIGFLAFAEVPDIWVWIGGAVISAATIQLARRESAIERGASAQAVPPGKTGGSG